MGLFRPFDESTALNEMSPEYVRGKSKAATDSKLRAQKEYKEKEAAHYADGHNPMKGQGTFFNTPGSEGNKLANKIEKRAQQSRDFRAYANRKERALNASAALLGISDEEFYELSEGNCNSDTCKCKGGTCPVDVTDGISTSSYAAKKLASAGSNNQTDLNAVKPNAEYSRQNDALFIGDGDSPETSKTNIPAILAAKTAGGAPHGWTTDNGINGTGPNVFKLRKLRDDDDGPNG